MHLVCDCGPRDDVFGQLFTSVRENREHSLNMWLRSWPPSNARGVKLDAAAAAAKQFNIWLLFISCWNGISRAGRRLLRQKMQVQINLCVIFCTKADNIEEVRCQFWYSLYTVVQPWFPERQQRVELKWSVSRRGKDTYVLLYNLLIFWMFLKSENRSWSTKVQQNLHQKKI